MELKLKEHLLGFLFLAPIFVAIPIVCMDQPPPPPTPAVEQVVSAPLSMKAVVDAQRDLRQTAAAVISSPESDRPPGR